ncbi:MAG: hypothetical protein LBU27_07710 [Candidatus Peribacteria bacterium]|jgi:hypothetical protein|nr:hypothetical protein [Candidatus Peribacteria bacterium]
MIDLALVEVELKKKLKYNYQWEKIQNDDGDSKTKFIYRSYKRDDLVQTVKRVWEEDTTISKTSLFNYATNRRYNFWSAQCVEEIFKQHINVSPTNDSYDKYKDFFIA